MSFTLPPMPNLPDFRPMRDPATMRARVATEAPRVPWQKFLRKLAWKQGEHVGLIGPTGQGKTTLLFNLLPLQPYNVVFATKPRDSSMDRLVTTGYRKLARWQSIAGKDEPRRVLWPDASRIDSKKLQRDVFADAFGAIYREGGWTVAIDELFYMTQFLKLEDEVKLLYTQGRSLGISLLAATQRPAWVPLEMYDQSTHLFLWRDNDETNLRRLSGISVRSATLIREIVMNLESHQVLYVNTRTGEMYRTRTPPPKG